MAKTTQKAFTFQEVAESLLARCPDIDSGHWGFWVKFGLGATNTTGPDGKLKPTVLLPLIEVGIQQFDTPNDLTVDASTLRAKKERPPSTRGSKKSPARKKT